jgi:hypothetical protein
MIWHSLIEGKEYKILQVNNDRIIIQREDQHNPQELTENRIKKAITYFNEQNCKVKRRNLISPTVAEETALVLFHPNLTWYDDPEFIIEI